MTDTIPDDIWEAARALRSAVNWQSNASVEVIARALRAERERAAKIAERHADENDEQAKKLMRRAAKLRRLGDPFGHGDMAAEGCAELTAAQHEALAIAAAIRGREA